MVQVAPSILAADMAHLADACHRVVTPQNPMLHFDVMDGVFVPNLTFGAPVLQSLYKAIPEAFYDVHLMIIDPLAFVEDFARAHANSITFHVEAKGNAVQTARAIRAQGCKAGVSLRPGTPVDRLFSLLGEVDMVLVMSVEPGFGGQQFIQESLSRIAALRAEALRQNTPLLIEVDGGINPTTGPQCVQQGADILVAGSAVFGANDPAKAIAEILGIL